MEINILGVKYIIENLEVDKNPRLKYNEAITNTADKKIIMSIRERPKEYYKKILRHEILHAFLYESGLSCNSNSIEMWSENEEMVDWFAIQSPKIFKIYKDLKIL